MKVLIRIQPCLTCRHDPGFGTLHSGCPRCVSVVEERDRQPRLVKTNDDPLTYEEAR